MKNFYTIKELTIAREGLPTLNNLLVRMFYKDIYRSTFAITWDLCLYFLIQRTAPCFQLFRYITAFEKPNHHPRDACIPLKCQRQGYKSEWIGLFRNCSLSFLGGRHTGTTVALSSICINVMPLKFVNKRYCVTSYTLNDTSSNVERVRVHTIFLCIFFFRREEICCVFLTSSQHVYQ